MGVTLTCMTVGALAVIAVRVAARSYRRSDAALTSLVHSSRLD